MWWDDLLGGSSGGGPAPSAPPLPQAQQQQGPATVYVPVDPLEPFLVEQPAGGVALAVPPSAPPLVDAPQATLAAAATAATSKQQQQQAASPPASGAAEVGPSGAPLPPGTALVAAPKIEAQPWVKELWQHVAARTVGVARVDLRRPTFLWPEDYDSSNILFRRGGARRRGRPRKQQPLLTYIPGDADGPFLPAGLGGQANNNTNNTSNRGAPTGARLKVMRCLQLKAPDSTRALLDLGVGVGVDLDRQELHGVARLKVADLLSVGVAPRPVLKLGGAWPVPGTGVKLRLKYEVPLRHLGEFWAPPARLMVRLDNDVGTGVHLTPTGVEFDERRLTLGSNTELRAGATLTFPRALPVDRDDADAFKLHVHRLSLRTLW